MIPTKDIFLAIAIAIAWAFNLVVIKFTIQSISPLTFACLRFTFVALPLVFFLKKPDVSFAKLFVVGLVLGVAKFALMFKGIEKGIGVGLCSLILQTQVIFTALFAFIIFGHKLTFREVSGIAVALTGLVMIATRNISASETFIGFSLVLMSAVTWGIANNISRTLQNVNILSFTVWMSLIPPIPYFLLSQIWEGPQVFFDSLAIISLKEILGITYITFVATIFGLTGWTWLMRQHQPAKISIYGLLIPVFSLIFGRIFFNEHLDLLEYLACLIIFAGLVINQWPKNKVQSTPIALKEAA